LQSEILLGQAGGTNATLLRRARRNLNIADGLFKDGRTLGDEDWAYITRGQVRSQLEARHLETFEVGQSFFEPPGATHLVSANASSTEPAELIAVFVADEGAELTTLVNR
jgi:hypothetical protein